MADAAPSTWDVELPDGTTVQDIPAGTTKAQLAQKLSANGYHVPDEWMGAKPGPDTAAYSAEGLPKPMPAWQGVGKELSGAADALGLTPLISALQAPGQSHAQRLNAAMARQGPLPGQPTPAQTYADMGRGLLGGVADVAGAPAAALNAIYSNGGGPGVPALMRHLGPQALKQDIGAIAQPQTSAGRTIEAGASMVAPEVIPPVLRGLGSVATPAGWRAAEARMAAREAAAGLPPAASSPPPPGGAPPPPNAAGFGADTASAARAAPINDPAFTPEDRAAIVRQFDNGRGAVNPTTMSNLALSRRISPDFQPLSGQLSGDLNVQREEINSSPRIPEIVERNETNRRVLGGQISELRNRVAPNAPDDNYAVNQAAVAKVQERLDDSRAQVNAAFDHARSVVSPDTPVVDARGLAEDIGSEPSFEWTPPRGDVASVIDRIRGIADSDSPHLTMAQLEQARTTLARVAREGEGTERYQAGLVRNMLEGQDFLPQAADAAAAFQDARNAAVRDFALRDEPAARNVIEGVKDVGRFLDNHAGTDSGVQSMRRIFGGDQDATDLISANLGDRMLEAAKMSAGQTGDLTAQGLGNFLRAKTGAIREAFGGENQGRLADLAEGARIITPLIKRAAASASQSNPLMAGVRSVGGALLRGAEGALGPPGRVAGGAIRAALGQADLNAIRARALDPHAALAIPHTRLPPVAEMGGPAGRAAEPAPQRWEPRPPSAPQPGAGSPPPSSPGPMLPPALPAAPASGPRPPPRPGPIPTPGGPPLPAILPPAPRAPVSAVGQGLQARRGGSAQARADFRTRMQQLADEHIARWNGASASDAPRTAPVAPPVASRSGPPPAPSIHQAALGRVTSLQGEILDALANPGIGEAGAKPLRENMATLRAHLTNAGVSAQDIQLAVEAGKPSGRALIETHEADPAETARQEEAMRQMNEEMKAEEERLKRLRPPKPGTQYNSARPFDINSLKPRK